MADFLPVLSAADIEHAAQLIQQANSPQSQLSPEQQRALQQQLFDVQKRPEAWGLIVPFLESQDPYVQFFGSHTAQVKIARDWDTFPHEYDLRLKDLLLELTGRVVTSRKDRFIVRKLFVATTALALRLASLPASDSSHWGSWIMNCVQTLSAGGAPTDYILEFLEISAQEVGRADLLGPAKARMRQTLLDVVGTVVQAIATVVQTATTEQTNQSALSPATSSQLSHAVKCMEAWLPTFPTSDLNTVLPHLFALLDSAITNSAGGSSNISEDIFVPVSDALQDILGASALSDGSGTKVLTEPLLLWFAAWGDKIVEETRDTGFAGSVSHSLCKLLVAVGDHSTQYIASNLTSVVSVDPSQAQTRTRQHGPMPKGQLVQSYLRLLLAYTSLPGHYGVDEEESDLTLGFWYLFQEALWNVDFDEVENNANAVVRSASSTSVGLDAQEQQHMTVAKAVYAEAVRVLRRKVVWPTRDVLRTWSKDAKDKFKVYRRDVGDALINAYYVLRDDMMSYFLSDISERLPAAMSGQGWEEVEGTIHCILSIQEAIPVEKNNSSSTNAQFSVLFGPTVLGRLPTDGQERVRLTMLYVIGEYSSWFTTLPQDEASSKILTAVSYIVSALREPQLCLAAANSLRDVCDQNRDALAPHIAAFSDLHSGIASIPDTEKSKVLQSIASVIQALPPQESIAPVETLVQPVLERLHATLQNPGSDVDQARTDLIQHFQILTGVAKGLTRANEALFALDSDEETSAEVEKMLRAQEDPRVSRLRDVILDAVRRTFEGWSTDAAISDALSDFLKAITALPSDMTVISLPAAPLLELVCVAAQRQLTAVWLSLASVLIVQLDPPPLFPAVLSNAPNEAARHTIGNLLPVLLQTCLAALSQPEAMANHPDIVQAFFGGMEKIAQHFTSVLYDLPSGALDTLIRSAVAALTLQERYSLVSACSFLASLVTHTSKNGTLGPQKETLAQSYGRLMINGVLAALAGSAPRSATQNIVELLSVFSLRYPAETRIWVSEILSAPDFFPSRAGPEAKNKFVQALNGPRSSKKLRDAAHEFSLVARGLEGTSFGYATVQA